MREQQPTGAGMAENGPVQYANTLQERWQGRGNKHLQNAKAGLVSRFWPRGLQCPELFVNHVSMFLGGRP